MRKIILRLEGGLGNQLFQYAFAKMIQVQYGGEILMDLHTYATDKQRSLSLNHFKLNKKVHLSAHTGIRKPLFFFIRLYSRLLVFLLQKMVKNKKIRVRILTFLGIFIQEDSLYYNHLHKCKSPIIFIAGNWMSEKFFENIKDEINWELEIKTPIDPKNKNILDKIKKTNSVCVHIRRGDYLDPEVRRKTFVCDFEYYENAMTLLERELEAPTFYIFSNTSDDIQWIKDNYKFSAPITFIDQNNPDYEDFRLMTNCKHFVMSNSTYSWWVAYLSKNPDKIVVSPSRWNNGIWDQSDIYCKYWELIEV